jgi:hypothetical protein
VTSNDERWRSGGAQSSSSADLVTACPLINRLGAPPFDTYARPRWPTSTIVDHGRCVLLLLDVG